MSSMHRLINVPCIKQVDRSFTNCMKDSDVVCSYIFPSPEFPIVKKVNRHEVRWVCAKLSIICVLRNVSGGAEMVGEDALPLSAPKTHPSGFLALHRRSYPGQRWSFVNSPHGLLRSLRNPGPETFASGGQNPCRCQVLGSLLSGNVDRGAVPCF